MQKIIEKFSSWWCIHEHEIAIFATVTAVLNLIFGIFAYVGMFEQIKFIHEIEMQLSAHGVEWALYTPVPKA